MPNLSSNPPDVAQAAREAVDRPQRSFADFLVERGVVVAPAVAEAQRKADEQGRYLEDVLTEQKAVEEDALYEAKAQFLELPLYQLEGPVSEIILRKIPGEAARHYRFVPLLEDPAQGRLDVGMLNPEDIAAQEALKFIAFREQITPHIFLIRPSDFEQVMRQYRSLRGEVKEALEELQEEIRKTKTEGERKTEEAKKPAKPEMVAEEAPITKLVAVITQHAIEGGASDIHIEPMKREVRVRFRVDGVLHSSLILPLQVHAAVVSRVKILSNLKIDVTRQPQDGRFPMDYQGRKIDFRVSTFPTTEGEKVVIRILDPEVGLRGFEDLGLEGRNLTLLQETVERPFGMILVTGPTGSGKTTTLYAVMNILNEEGVNIVSLEDPVEYHIEGIAQSQVRPEIGYSFATGLRHILRQDPDIIMVGEIRDEETAALAVHAALTGHLVLSTLHTNDAIGVIPRLIDMGVDPYLLPPSLILAAAQRLVRRLCPDSRKEVKASKEVEGVIQRELSTLPESERKRLPNGGEPPYTLYEPVASKACPRGTKGRVAIFEMIKMTSELEGIVLESPSESKIRAEAQRQGMATMKQDGIIKALNGIVSLEEVFKVVEVDT